MAKPTKYHHRAVFSNKAGYEPDGGSDRGLGYSECYHKRAHSASPYLVANEIIAAKIGQLIGLPIPPCGVTISDIGQVWFSSFYFNFDKVQLPDVQPDELWAWMPSDHTGIVLFDIFIANADRHEKNLSVDAPLKPTAVQVFDHDQCLFSNDPVHGVERLKAVQSQLGVTPDTGGSRNDFIDEIDTTKHFGKWLKRIDSIPDWFIQQAVDSTKDYGVSKGISKEDAARCTEFLIQRKRKFKDLLRQGKAHFKGISDFRLPGELFS